MEKLSIEDKTKAYDDAFGRAKEKYAMFKGMKQGDVLEDVFPELKESEDEKIRKEIIAILKYKYEHFPKDTKYRNAPQWIAWLEKQGDANKEYWRGYREGKQEILDKYAEIEKQDEQNLIMAKSPQLSEQNPADKAEPKFRVKYAGSEYNVLEVKDIAGVTYYGIEDEPNHIDYVQAGNCERVGGYSIKGNGPSYPTKPAVFSEQKPAWSEEDDNKINSIKYLLHELDNHNFDNWLKSLKDRVQPKQEWSVDDEQYLLVCKNALAKYQTTDKWDAHIISHWLEDKLKSLRSQNRWKPSDEQMLALEAKLTIPPQSTAMTSALIELYQQLKKLRNE